MNNKILWSLIALFVAMSGALAYTSYQTATAPARDQTRQTFRELRTNYDDLRDAYEDFVDSVRNKPAPAIMEQIERIDKRFEAIEECLGLKAASPSKRCGP